MKSHQHYHWWGKMQLAILLFFDIHCATLHDNDRIEWYQNGTQQQLIDNWKLINV